MAKVNYIELNNTLKPINKNTVKAIERNSAKYIYVNRDRVAKCERCESEFTLANAKHRAIEKCPKCHRLLEVIHTWRKSSNESIHWESTATAINDTLLAIRYYLVVRKDGKITDSCERARMFVSTDKKEFFKVERNIWNGTWRKSGNSYFREYHMGYQTNRFCCLGAKVRDSYFKEVKKLTVMKFFDLQSVADHRYYPTDICYITQRMSLYEKMQKVGLNSLIMADINSYYSDEIKYDKKASELTKMLCINKNSLNLLKSAPTLNALRLLQSNPNINEREFIALNIFNSYQLDTVNRCSDRIGATPYKVATYINKQGASANELDNYLHMLTRNGYDIKDKSYSMPKDLSKEMARLHEEDVKRLEREEKERKEFEEKKNELIKAVYDKLTGTKELQEFFEGVKGFMASVPMSEEDFIAEGKAQHNCVGRGYYADSVAKEETLVFFIREIDKPDAPFVTMEYCNGSIVQCMLDHNERVKEDAKVYDFCSALANRLNECQILSA